MNASSSLAEVIDRILDKGIVVDTWVRVSLVGIELLAIEARMVIAGVDTYLKYAEAVGLTTMTPLEAHVAPATTQSRPWADSPDPVITYAPGAATFPLIETAPITQAATTAGEQQAHPQGDDLTAINGIGPAFRRRLNGIGIYTFAQLALTDETALREALGTGARLANTDSWIAQAQVLAGLPS
jgi:predicted flap endonuclease-1-like 5' DNA nuclease